MILLCMLFSFRAIIVLNASQLLLVQARPLANLNIYNYPPVKHLPTCSVNCLTMPDQLMSVLGCVHDQSNSCFCATSKHASAKRFLSQCVSGMDCGPDELGAVLRVYNTYCKKTSTPKEKANQTKGKQNLLFITRIFLESFRCSILECCSFWPSPEFRQLFLLVDII